MEIKHRKTTSKTAYDTEICEFWIDLPSGARIFFSDVELSEWNSDAEEIACINEAKNRIVAGLRELMFVSQ